MFRRFLLGSVISLACIAPWATVCGQEPSPTGGFPDATATRFELGSLVRSSGVQKELKLSAEQIVKVRGTRTTPATEQVIQETLTAEQTKRLRQILRQRQVRTGAAALFRNPSFVAHLNLNADQATQLQAILIEDAKRKNSISIVMSEVFGNRDLTTEERSQKLGAVRAASDEARKTSDARLQALLTAEQQAKYKESLGEPFVGSLSPSGTPDTGGRDGGRRTTRLGSSEAPIVRFFREPQFHAELKLTPEQIAPATALPRIGDVDLARLQQIFTPEQIRRARELTLQNAVLVAGPGGPFRYRWVIEALRISDDQRAKLQAVHDETYLNYLSMARRTSVASQRVEWDSSVNERAAAAERAELDRTVNERVAAIVGPEQLAKLKSLLGAPYPESLLATGGGFSAPLGSLSAPNLSIVREAAFHDELKLTPEQIRKAIALPTIGEATNHLPPEDFLSPEQLRRAQELTLQVARQASGPTGPLLFKMVIDALAPSPEQRTTLQAILSSRRFGGRTPADDKSDEDRLAAALTPEQQNRLKQLPGAPFSFPARSAATYFEIGRVGTAPNLLILFNTPVRQELKLDDKQMRLLTDIRSSTARRSLRESLSPEQSKRAAELTYQDGRRRFGPAGAFVYAPLADELQLTAEQRAAVRAVLADSAKQTISRVSAGAAEQDAARRTEQDAQLETRLAKILRPDQQTKLKEFMGAPYEGRLTPTQPASVRPAPTPSAESPRPVPDGP